MRVIKLIMIMVAIFALSGCQLFGKEPIEPQVIVKTVTIEKPLIHYPLPTPVNFHKGVPRVITKETIANEPDNVVFQAFEWNDGQELRISLEDLDAHIRQLMVLLCSYRKELNEDRCKPYIGESSVVVEPIEVTVDE